MGAVEVRDVVVAESARKAWEKLGRESMENYGSNPYNGSFSTCCYRGLAKKFVDGTMKENLKEAELFADQKINGIGKRDAYAIDCGVDHYELVSVKKVKATGRPKQKFVIAYHDGLRDWVRVFSTLKEAQTEAANVVLNNSFVEYVSIQKRSVYDCDSSSAFTYTRSIKTLKSKPKRIPKGSRLVEYRKYYFYGWAAE